MNFQQPQSSGVRVELPESVKSGIQSVSTGIQNVQNNVSNSLSQFSQQAQTGVGASSQFLQSNTIIAKIAFLILVLFGFIFLMYLGIYLIFYFTATNKSNPYLINGMISGTTPMVIPQDPSQKNAVIIERSNNQTTGLEYTWSFWIFITDLPASESPPKYQHIMNKGNNSYDATGLATVNNAPGIYLTTDNSTQAKLHIIIDTVVATDTNTSIDIPNVPIKKWVHVAVRIKNTIMDVYVNGVIASRLLLTNLAKQNYEDVFVCQNGGFAGNLSSLRYYSSALNVFDINSIVAYGPNIKSVVNLSTGIGANYLSSNWYSYNQ